MRALTQLNAKAFSGGLIVLVFILVGIFGPLLAPHDPNRQELTAMLKPPQGLGEANALGTDNLGRDIASRIIHGARVSLLVAFAVLQVLLASMMAPVAALLSISGSMIIQFCTGASSRSQRYASRAPCR